MDPGILFFSALAGVGVAAVAIGIFCSGKSIADDAWQEELIDRGLARYNDKTGEWEWIEDLADTKGMSKT